MDADEVGMGATMSTSCSEPTRFAQGEAQDRSSSQKTGLRYGALLGRGSAPRESYTRADKVVSPRGQII
jgi:hypothetical protein